MKTDEQKDNADNDKTTTQIDEAEAKDDAQDEIIVDPDIIEDDEIKDDELVVLRAKVESLEAELAAARERYVRQIAESDNYRKRIAKEKEDFRKIANEKLLKDILPVLDNMKRALDAADQAGNVPKTFLDGIKMVEREFLRVLNEAGVNPVESVPGAAFDPTIHEALHRVETEEQPPGTVVRYLQDGYMYHERLLRPALVLVAAEPEKTVPEFALDPEKLKKAESDIEMETDSE